MALRGAGTANRWRGC